MYVDYNSASAASTVGDVIEIRNPATGEIVGHVSTTGPAEIREAVSRAREAQHRWRHISPSERSRIIRHFHNLILSRRDHILDTIQSETGKARRDALAELITVAGTARYYVGRGQGHLKPKPHHPAIPAITSAEVIYKPHGLVGLITPWNYPFLLTAGDALPALIAGNAVMIKPSELKIGRAHV